MVESKNVKLSIPHSGDQPAPKLAGNFTEWAPSIIGTIKDEKVVYSFKIKEPRAIFKFVSENGEWFTSPKFATETDENGNVNNFFVVEDFLKSKKKSDKPASPTTTTKEASESSKENTLAAPKEATELSESVSGSTTSLDSKGNAKPGIFRRIIGSIKRKDKN